VAAVHTRFGLTTDTHVVLFGKGLIGRNAPPPVAGGQERLRRDHGLSLKVIGVCGRDELLFDPGGLDAERTAKSTEGASLRGLGARRARMMRRSSNASCTTQRMDVVLVDVTAAETIPLHALALQKRHPLVTANKSRFPGSLRDYKNLRNQAFAHGRVIILKRPRRRLPVLFTLQICWPRTIAFCASPVASPAHMGYICSGLQEGRLFSEMVREAKSLGFTEPDPRDDLSGLDVGARPDHRP
jgi:aspartokinase/homoserine dehydrogenase 1